MSDATSKEYRDIGACSMIALLSRCNLCLILDMDLSRAVIYGVPHPNCSPWVIACNAICCPNAPNPMINKCRSEEHTSELQSRGHLVCRLLLEKKKKK